MRIVSQGGHADLPYEQVVIYMDYENIMARIGDKEYLMGRYKTTEQIKKVMDMLHKKYEHFSTATNTSNFYTMFNNPKVFYFPKAEDAE